MKRIIITISSVIVTAIILSTKNSIRDLNTMDLYHEDCFLTLCISGHILFKMTKVIHQWFEFFSSQEEGAEFMKIDCDLENIIISMILKMQFILFCF